MEQGADQGVGARIKRLREEREWSMAKLAVEADMSVSGVSMIETGKRNLTTTTLAKLARAFGVEVADLFPKAEAQLWSDNGPGLHQYDFGAVRDGLTLFCDYWEKRVEDGNITRREFSDVGATIEGWLPALEVALGAERNEILKAGKRSQDPFWSSQWKEITGSEVLSMSEVWGAAERLFPLGEKLAAMEEEAYGANIEAEKRRQKFTLLRNTA